MKIDLENQICPFCQQKLNTTTYAYSNITMSCSPCRLFPYEKYSITHDTFTDMYYFSIVLDHDSQVYAVSVGWSTDVERLIKVTAPDTEDYYLPVSVVSVNAGLPFDINNPIKSGQEILQRLLALRAFS